MDFKIFQSAFPFDKSQFYQRTIRACGKLCWFSPSITGPITRLLLTQELANTSRTTVKTYQQILIKNLENHQQQQQQQQHPNNQLLCVRRGGGIHARLTYKLHTCESEIIYIFIFIFIFLLACCCCCCRWLLCGHVQRALKKASHFVVVWFTVVGLGLDGVVGLGWCYILYNFSLHSILYCRLFL